MQNDGNDMIGQQETTAGAPATGGKGFGKGLLNLAKASAREAGRGAKLAALKTQIEKLKRMDLANALAALGSKAHEMKALTETFGSLYADIDGLDEGIKAKRAGVTAKDDDGFAEKAKAKAISVKMGAEAQALEHKRKNKCGEIGRAIIEGGTVVDGLGPEIQAIADIQRRIDELNQQLGAVAEDRTGRDAFMSSAKSLGADAKAASKSPMWKKPAVWVGIAAVLVVSAAVMFFKGGGSGRSGSETAQTPDQAGRAEGSTGPGNESSRWGAGYGKDPKVLISTWGVTLKEIEKVANFSRYTEVQRAAAFKELWERALVLEGNSRFRYMFLKYPNGLKYKIMNVRDLSDKGYPYLYVSLSPADDAAEQKITDADRTVLDSTRFSMNLSHPPLVALLSDKQIKNLNLGDEIRSDDWILAVAFSADKSMKADIVFRKDSEYLTIVTLLGYSI